MDEPIIIGTRGSDLALWQANKVKDSLAEKGHDSELKIIHSTGDKDRKAKLHEMGLVGVFTKELDDALLLGEIDIAVHSLKDVPTSPPKGIVQAAVLERANPYDLLISDKSPDKTDDFKLASGSLRRRAFWKNRYPNHELIDLRGNVPTRLAKVEEGETDGVILAKAGLDRLNMTPKHAQVLEWMTPAPAQGIVGVFCLNKNTRCKEILAQINHKDAEICAHVERQLLSTLEGGCTAPIGALAQIVKRSVEVKASLLSEDGKIHVYQTFKKGKINYLDLGKEAAEKMLENGGREIMRELKLGTKEPQPLHSAKAPQSKVEHSHAVGTHSIKTQCIAQAASIVQTKKEEIKKRSEAERTKKTSNLKPQTSLPTGKASNSRRVLCLKKLTPPRIKAGAKLGLELTGIEVIETLPNFNTVEVKQLLSSKNNWVFSSLNAVSAITSVLKNTASIHKHIYCVGSRVANFFEGKVKSIHQVNSVDELAEKAAATGEKDFVWFHGSKSDLNLIQEFELLEMELKAASVYRTELSEPRIEKLEDYDIYAFFSPSGVDSFNAHNYIPESAIVAAIGSTTAEYLAHIYDEQENTQLENIIVPDTFEYEHLLNAITASQKA